MNKYAIFFFVFSFCQISFGQIENTESNQYEWLGNRHSEEVIEWVDQQNTKSLNYLDSIELLSYLEKWKIKFDKEYDWKIFNKFLPEAEQVGPFAQRISKNTWTRMSFEKYLKGKKPKFQVSIQELKIKPKKNWIYDKVISNSKNYDQSLVFYKKQGHKTLKGIVEFDFKSKSLVEDGFQLSPANTTAQWRDEQSIYICTNLENPYDPGSKVRMWKRGQPIESAEVIFESNSSKVEVELISLRNEIFIKEQRQAYDESWYHLKDDVLNALFLPKDAKDLAVVSGQLVILLRGSWSVNNVDFPPSSLISIDFESFLNGNKDFRLIAASTKEFILDQIWNTKDVLIVRALNNVQSSLYEWHFNEGEWKSKYLKSPVGWNISVSNVQEEANRYYIKQNDFISSKYHFRDQSGVITKYAEYFNKTIETEKYAVKQQFATSKDGTEVHYFLIHKKGLKRDGNTPVIMTGYGGWGYSILPNPLYTKWRWINDGGAYVIANIRGGGEFGNEWHYSGIQSKRQNAYDDFFAVAQALIDSGLTQERGIGIWGGSNGGLLVANSFIQHPTTFGAVLIRSGSLKLDDIYVKEGGSMIEVGGERGDPENADDWAYMKKISPFHVIEKNKPYPPVLLLSSRNDDVSHPSRSRKFFAKSTALGYHNFFLIETEGGSHGYTDLKNDDLLDLAFFYRTIHPDYHKILENEVKQ